MPVLEIGLAAAAAAVGASYLLPMIISCIGGVIVAIAAFFAGFRMARRRNETDLSGLKKQQHERDKQTRQEAEDIVMQTDQNVRDILSQTQKQQTRLDQTITSFQEEIDTSTEITERFENVTYDIREVAARGEIKLAEMSTKISGLNTELIHINDLLKIKEQNLDEKDALLKNTIDKLIECEQKASHDASVCIEHIQELQLKITNFHLKFNIFRKANSLENEHVENLREQNKLLTATIDKLEKTVLDLSASLENATTKNEHQYQEVKRLFDENKLLSLLVEDFSKIVESESLKMKGEPCQSNTTSMRLFR